MKIYLAEHMGFCYGVKRAVEMALKSGENNRAAATLGPLIHNPQMVTHLAEQGVGVIDDLNEMDDGTVIIRSHGAGPDIYALAAAKGLSITDATCPHVKKAQQAARMLAQEGYRVIVLGERHHPEVQSIVQWAGQDVTVVETLEEARAVPKTLKLGVVAQTTFARDLFQELVQILKTKTNDLKVDRTICTATDMRQQAAAALARKVNVMVVIGGKNSGNTTRLAQVCREAGAAVYHIETAAELDKEWFAGVQTAGITAGASTPDWIIEEVYQTMQEMNELENTTTKLEAGMIVKGKIVGVRKDEVFVDIGYKAEGVIALAELSYPAPEQASDVVAEGQIIDVLVIDADTVEGNVQLSKVQADKIVAWEELEQAFANKTPIEGKVTAVVKGGLSVAVFGVRAFVPASQVDLYYTEDLGPFVGQTLELVPIEVDTAKQKAVLSRKVLLAEKQRQREAELLAQLTEGQIVKGTVKRLADFGAFVDIGGIDALIHISDLSWERVKSVAEVVQVGDEVEASVIKLDREAKRVGLSLKQLQRDPWCDAVAEFSEGMTVKGRVTKIAKFGAFVELKKGVEGLVHLSELSDRRVASASEVVEPGQAVVVKILDIDEKAKRVALSIAQARQDAERAEYNKFLGEHKSTGVTIGDRLGHLFKHNN